MLTEKEYKFGLARLNGIGLKKYSGIIKLLGSAESFWQKDSVELFKILSPHIPDNIIRNRDVKKILEEVEYLNKNDIRYYCLGDNDYPQLLSEISDPPPVIYVKGDADINILNSSITVVGTRMNTSYSDLIMKKLIKELVKNGFTITSGLAFGVDKLAHKYALEYGGNTIAVTAGSVDSPSPKSNIRVYESILANGLVISENFPGSELVPGHFPMRNRILAGLSKSTVVIEAPERSGALITAHLAFDYNREVFAFPGRIDQKNSKGCNKLIKIQKAKLVEMTDDILVELGYNLDHEIMNTRSAILNSKEKGIVDVIRNYPLVTIDEIASKLNCSLPQLAGDITNLEIKGVVSDENGRYTLVC